MTYELAFNTTPGPVVIDDEGRTIGGGEFGAADTAVSSVQALVERGALIRVDKPDGRAAAEVGVAVKLVSELNSPKARAARKAAEAETDDDNIEAGAGDGVGVRAIVAPTETGLAAKEA